MFSSKTRRDLDSCAKEYKIYNGKKIIYEKSNNHQAINRIIFDKPIITNELKVVLSKKEKKIPVSLYKISAYSEKQP